MISFSDELRPHLQETLDAFTSNDIKLKVSRDPLIANFAVRDLLFNDDSYVGAGCSGIKVSKFVMVEACAGSDQFFPQHEFARTVDGIDRKQFATPQVKGRK